MKDADPDGCSDPENGEERCLPIEKMWKGSVDDDRSDEQHRAWEIVDKIRGFWAPHHEWPSELCSSI